MIILDEDITIHSQPGNEPYRDFVDLTGRSVDHHRDIERPRSYSNDRNWPTNNAAVTHRDGFVEQADQSDFPAFDHMTQATQSDSSTPSAKNSNVTCGNCGGKGHNRTFVKCPKYHTAEESARREVLQFCSEAER